MSGRSESGERRFDTHSVAMVEQRADRQAYVEDRVGVL